MDPQEVMKGVSDAKYRVAQRLGHLEKTRGQQAPTIVKTMHAQNFVPSRRSKKVGKGISS